MKFKIVAGKLFIKRNGSECFAKHFCPFVYIIGDGEKKKPCGDWCPHFGEVKAIIKPIYVGLDDSYNPIYDYDNAKKELQLTLCHGKTLVMEASK